jgi:hypothetical protein
LELITKESKVWWLAPPDEIRATRGIFIVDAIGRLAKEFQFAGVPTSLPPPNEGLTFREGRMLVDDRQIVIGELVIFNDGVTVRTFSTTDDCDLVLERALAIGAELGLRTPITAPVRFYQSFLVFELSKSIDRIINGYEKLFYLLEQSMHLPSSAHLGALMFSVDPETLPKRIASINPTAFRIERRTDIPFDRNRYFSMANTSTGTHLAILEEIERSI